MFQNYDIRVVGFNARLTKDLVQNTFELVGFQ